MPFYWVRKLVMTLIFKSCIITEIGEAGERKLERRKLEGRKTHCMASGLRRGNPGRAGGV
jgi:hypothetical protein